NSKRASGVYSPSLSRQPQHLAVCALCDPVVFSPGRVAVSRPLRSADLRTVRNRVAPDQRRADKPPSSELRPASLDWHFLSAFLFHRPGPDHDSVWVPASRLPPAHAGYVCCAVWKAGCASPCRPALFITAEPAVTAGFSDRGETRNLSQCQCPGQRRDRSYSRNGPEAFDSLRQQRVPL